MKPESEHIKIKGTTSMPSAREEIRRDLGDNTNDAIHEFYRRREIESDSEELLQILMDENNIDRDLATSILGTVKEHRAKIPGFGKVIEDVSKWRDPIQRMHDIECRAFRHYFVTVLENQSESKMTFRCLMLLLDQPAVAGAENLEQLVTVCGGDVTHKSQFKALKQTVNKCLKGFQKKVPQLPKIPGQRGYKACRNMEEAQYKIWHGQK
jgi:hypothetical protein